MPAVVRHPRVVLVAARLVLPDLRTEGDSEPVPAIDTDDGHRQLD